MWAKTKRPAEVRQRRTEAGQRGKKKRSPTLSLAKGRAELEMVAAAGGLKDEIQRAPHRLVRGEQQQDEYWLGE